MPTMNKRMLIRNSRISGFSDRPRMKSAMVSGAWLRLTTVLKATAAPTSSSTVEELSAARVSAEGRSLNFIERRMKKETISA